MATPSGKVVDRPMVKRACGCVCEFQYYSVDRFRAERLAKFQTTRCPNCVAKLEQERRLFSLPKKGDAFKALPAGATIHLEMKADGSWLGILTAEGEKVEAVEPLTGPQALILTLTRLWLADQRPMPAPTPPA
jgi:hypothetical protein